MFLYFIRQHTKVTACDNMRLSFDLINLRHYAQRFTEQKKKERKTNYIILYTNQNAGMEPCSFITDSLCLHKMAMKTYWQPMNLWFKKMLLCTDVLWTSKLVYHWLTNLTFYEAIESPSYKMKKAQEHVAKINHCFIHLCLTSKFQFF